MANSIAQLPTTTALTPAFLGNAPAPFLQMPDSDKDNWNVWLSAWNNYLSVFTALSPGQLTDAVKNAMLLNALGAEGFRKLTANPILSNPATMSYTDFQSAATRLFPSKALRYVPYAISSAAVNIQAKQLVVS